MRAESAPSLGLASDAVTAIQSQDSDTTKATTAAIASRNATVGGRRSPGLASRCHHPDRLGSPTHRDCPDTGTSSCPAMVAGRPARRDPAQVRRPVDLGTDTTAEQASVPRSTGLLAAVAQDLADHVPAGNAGHPAAAVGGAAGLVE